MSAGQFSPHLNLALFSGVHGRPAGRLAAQYPRHRPDPARCRARRSERRDRASFSESGPAPVVFTLGSSAVGLPRAAHFYDVSAAAAAVARHSRNPAGRSDAGQPAGHRLGRRPGHRLGARTPSSSIAPQPSSTRAAPVRCIPRLRRAVRCSSCHSPTTSRTTRHGSNGLASRGSSTLSTTPHSESAASSRRLLADEEVSSRASVIGATVSLERRRPGRGRGLGVHRPESLVRRPGPIVRRAIVRQRPLTVVPANAALPVRAPRARPRRHTSPPAGHPDRSRRSSAAPALAGIAVRCRMSSHNRVGDPGAPREFPGELGRDVVLQHAQDAQVVAMPVLKGGQCRHLTATGPAPGGPHVHDDDLALPGSEGDGPPVEVDGVEGLDWIRRLEPTACFAAPGRRVCRPRPVLATPTGSSQHERDDETACPQTTRQRAPVPVVTCRHPSSPVVTCRHLSSPVVTRVEPLHRSRQPSRPGALRMVAHWVFHVAKCRCLPHEHVPKGAGVG